MKLDPSQEHAITRFLRALVDQQRARIVIPPIRDGDGCWFGGGNLVQTEDGSLWLTGRYRVYGDSRTGLKAGERGLEAALFRSNDGGKTFEKVRSWSKADLSRPGKTVLSIEGTALHQRPDQTWELFVSSEKDVSYPAGFQAFQKPGTGVWSIDVMTGASPETLDGGTLTDAVWSQEPDHLHVKDPNVFDSGGTTTMAFCTHPFSWASSNTGLAHRRADDAPFEVGVWDAFARGNSWDVAAVRVTNVMRLPNLGLLTGAGDLAVLFYDGAESLRSLDENPKAVSRPRGYSCEELGGAMVAPVRHIRDARKLSRHQAMFVSPHGTGSSRYLSTLVTQDAIYATWQQAQPDGSQPLVINTLSMHEVEALLSDPS
ncbi:MAG: hypothetical protein JSV66_06625 [Trueperaceae bacterium]|nr:MAG: hypothetical protein JSV66_06625 [Trueperaceae bacterium]